MSVTEQPGVVENVRVEAGVLHATVRLNNTCTGCGDILRSKKFDVQQDVSNLLHHNPDEAWFPQVGVCKRVSREFPPHRKRRYKFYGFELVVQGVCACGDGNFTQLLSGEVQASEMEDFSR